MDAQKCVYSTQKMNAKIKRAIQDHRINLDNRSKMTDEEIETYWFYEWQYEDVSLEDVAQIIRDVEDALFYEEEL